jgi:hypothetical protein
MKPVPEDCGCDGAEEFASTALAELDENEPNLTPDPRGNTVRKWSGLIAPYGTPTGDGRRFASGALTARELPLPVKWQRTDNAGHATSVVVGRIDALDYRDDGVYASGIIFDPDPQVLPRLAEDANEAYELLKQKVNGPSVDLDAMEFHPVGEPDEFSDDGKRPEIEVTKGRISAGTLVPIPAFAEARPFSLEDVNADDYATETALTAAGVRRGLDMFGVAPEGYEWSLADWLIEGDTTGALYEDADRALFPVAEDFEGAMALVPSAVADAISVMAYSSDRVDLPEGVKDVLRARLEELAAACDLPNPPWAQAALVASAVGRTKLPAAAFTDPKLTKPTPPQFETLPDGRIRTYGHVASWKTCHIGFQDKCVTAPRSRSNYSYFHVGSVETDKGRIPAGKLTLGGGHADTRAGFQAAVAHYDDTSTVAADVVIGEDKHGIWYSGIVRPELTQAQLDEFAAAPLSGDWRRVGGSMELIAALAVNTPGFPIPQVREDNAGAFALVAAGAMMDPDMDAKRLKAKAKGKKKVVDPDNDGDHDYASVVRAVFAEIRAEERAQRQDAEIAATLAAEFGALDQLHVAEFASVFE